MFFLHKDWWYSSSCFPWQAMAFAGFTHSCQLELSKALRKALSRDEASELSELCLLKMWWFGHFLIFFGHLPLVIFYLFLGYLFFFFGGHLTFSFLDCFCISLCIFFWFFCLFCVFHSFYSFLLFGCCFGCFLDAGHVQFAFWLLLCAI